MAIAGNHAQHGKAKFSIHATCTGSAAHAVAGTAGLNFSDDIPLAAKPQAGMRERLSMADSD
jgi:hypothetical protein